VVLFLSPTILTNHESLSNARLTVLLSFCVPPIVDKGLLHDLKPNKNKESVRPRNKCIDCSGYRAPFIYRHSCLSININASGLTLSVAIVAICDYLIRLAIIFAFWLATKSGDYILLPPVFM
jgi:hypothetical protein